MPYVPMSAIPDDFRLRTSVMHIIDRPLDELSVSEICKRSKISRSKFYKLFGAKYGIGLWHLSFVQDVSLGRIGDIYTWADGVSLCLDLLDEERSYYTRTYKNPDKLPDLFWAVQESRREAIVQTLKTRGIEITRLLETEITTYIELVDILLRQWITQPPALSHDEYVSFWLECVPRELFARLELGND